MSTRSRSFSEPAFAYGTIWICPRWARAWPVMCGGVMPRIPKAIVAVECECTTPFGEKNTMKRLATPSAAFTCRVRSMLRNGAITFGAMCRRMMCIEE